MFYLSVLILIFGVTLVMIGSTKIAKKDYDINVQLQPDVEQIIKKSVDEFMEKYYSVEKQCNHKWVTVKSGKIKKDGGATGFFYDLQCENCGDITTRET